MADSTVHHRDPAHPECYPTRAHSSILRATSVSYMGQEPARGNWGECAGWSVASDEHTRVRLLPLCGDLCPWSASLIIFRSVSTDIQRGRQPQDAVRRLQTAPQPRIRGWDTVLYLHCKHVYSFPGKSPSSPA